MTNPKSEIRIFDPDGKSLGGLTPSRSPDALRLLAAAWVEFDCHPTVYQSCSVPEEPRRSNRRRRVTEITNRFLSSMASASPPRTEAEAIAALTPITAWLLSWLIRQLAIQVIKFLWRRWHDPQSSILDPPGAA